MGKVISLVGKGVGKVAHVLAHQMCDLARQVCNLAHQDNHLAGAVIDLVGKVIILVGKVMCGTSVPSSGTVGFQTEWMPS